MHSRTAQPAAAKPIQVERLSSASVGGSSSESFDELDSESGGELEGELEGELGGGGPT